MASGGQVVPPRPDNLDVSMDDDRHKFTIHGKGLATPIVPDLEVTSVMSQFDNSTTISSSRPSTSNTLDDPGEPIGTLQLPSDAFGVLETVINMNKTLEHQVEALRLRIDVEEKQHATEKRKAVQEKENDLKNKEKELESLRESVFNRDERIDILLKEKEEQELEITDKMDEIKELQELVMQTEGHADKLTKKVNKLKDEKRHLESDAVYKQQNDEIRKLRHELSSVKDRLTAMENELTRAKNIIEQQNRKIKTLEIEKGEMNYRFKDELGKASKAMRQEVERMREVMKQQYEEMRNLREQNLEISTDVRDIKELLLQRSTEQVPQRGTTRENLSVNNFYSNGTRGAKVTPTNNAPNSNVRFSMPTLKVGETPNPARGGLPPIGRENVKDGKWVPSGTSKRSMNTLSTKNKRT